VLLGDSRKVKVKIQDRKISCLSEEIRILMWDDEFVARNTGSILKVVPIRKC
jgi:hypothetical protein